MKKQTNHHQEHLDRRKIRSITFISFLFGFSDALYIYVLSSYFSEVIHSESVGIFYVASAAIILFFLAKLHRFFRKIGGSIRSFFLFMLIAIISAFFLSLLSVGWLGIFPLLVLIISTNLAWVTLDVILEEYSADIVTGRVRGFFLAIMNAGFMLGPLLSTVLITGGGFNLVFAALTLGYSVLLGCALFFLHDGRGYSTAKMNFEFLWRDIFKRPEILRIYTVAFSLEFFYAIMTIYMPIYLHQILGFSWTDIGIVFTIMLIPFILLQYPIGRLADKYLGEKELILAGIVISALATFSVGISRSENLIFWAAILFVTRIGAASIEMLRDSYFYKQIDGSDDGLIAFFRTARPVANIAGPFLSILMLIFFPLQSVFFLVVGVFGITFLVALPLQDTKSEYDRRG